MVRPGQQATLIPQGPRDIDRSRLKARGDASIDPLAGRVTNQYSLANPVSMEPGLCPAAHESKGGPVWLQWTEDARFYSRRVKIQRPSRRLKLLNSRKGRLRS